MATSKSAQSYYPDSFFNSIEEGALRSARVVVPLLLRIIEPSSVIDVGCGRGAWLRVFREHGASRLNGIDGDYISRSTRLISENEFLPVDLSRPFRIHEKYDLALCLEVAEHLPFSMGPHLVRQLTAAAPLVLFSAAIPGQGGQNHINEQWPSYWQELFKEHGFVLLDPIRPQIWHDRRVEWWYRQNICLYAAAEKVRVSATLRAAREIGHEQALEWVHVSMARSSETANPGGSVRGVCKLLPGLIVAAVRRRYKKFLPQPDKLTT